jgi:predicted Zn-dependent protease
MPRISRLSLRFLAGSLTLATALSAPLTAQTGQTTPVQAAGPAYAISAQDRAQGAEAHPQLVAEFGGAVSGPQATYVETIAKNVAVRTGLSNARNDFTVTLLNSSVNNAFAIPGGYIYVTRQLVGLMNNEAELAAVMAHEARHVAGRHAAQRQGRATRNTVIGAGAAWLAGRLLGTGGLGSLVQRGLLQGSQILTLSYSRGQETEADNYGIDYMRAAGYNPLAMSTVLKSLADQNTLEARLMGNSTQVPQWASSHPPSATRIPSAAARAGTNPTGILNRDTFLTRISGIMYGDDPQQGVVEGRHFIHPGMRIAFDAPDGFYMMNGTNAVSIGGQSGKGELTNAAYSGDLEAYITAAFAGLTQQGQAQIRPSAIERREVNGIRAAVGTARVSNGQGQVDVVVYAYELASNQAVHFLTVSQAGGATVFDPMFQSMRRISATEAAAVRPRKVTVVTARRGDTVQSLAARMAYTDAPLDRFLVLNALTAQSTIAVGQKVKLVTY